jgi:hypothetical protein
MAYVIKMANVNLSDSLPAFLARRSYFCFETAESGIAIDCPCVEVHVPVLPARHVHMVGEAI